MKQYLNRLIDGELLSREDTHNILLGIVAGKYNDCQIAALLMAMQTRGVTVDELLGKKNPVVEKMVKKEEIVIITAPVISNTTITIGLVLYDCFFTDEPQTGHTAAKSDISFPQLLHFINAICYYLLLNNR